MRRLAVLDDAGNGGQKECGEEPAEKDLNPDEHAEEPRRANPAKKALVAEGLFLRFRVGLPFVGLTQFDERKCIFERIDDWLKSRIVWRQAATGSYTLGGIFVSGSHSAHAIGTKE